MGGQPTGKDCVEDDVPSKIDCVDDREEKPGSG